MIASSGSRRRDLPLAVADLSDGEARVGCPFRNALMSSGPTEVGQNAITHELGYMSLITCNLTRHGVLYI
jgi:hypothetical protein